MLLYCTGSNSFRISLEWSRLYPKRGQLDQEAVKRYHEMFDEMDRRALSALWLHGPSDQKASDGKYVLELHCRANDSELHSVAWGKVAH